MIVDDADDGAGDDDAADDELPMNTMMTMALTLTMVLANVNGDGADGGRGGYVADDADDGGVGDDGVAEYDVDVGDGLLHHSLHGLA